MPAKWYVSFVAFERTDMKVADTRDAAIALACKMLDGGVNVQEIGPLIDLPLGNVIDAAGIRALRNQAGRHPAP